MDYKFLTIATMVFIIFMTGLLCIHFQSMKELEIDAVTHCYELPKGKNTRW